MRTTTLCLIGASSLAFATHAQATTFVFASGNYMPGVTAPEPLMSPDILELTSSSSKLFTAVTLTNQSGTVNWNAGNLFLASGSVINNQSQWNAFGDNSINPNGGATSSFLNSGVFSKSVGIGTTAINNIAFVNSGTINAQTGTIAFNGGNATFNAGSLFSGGGIVAINNNATFNGGFTSANLDFNAGAFTGNNAALTGTADWTNGTFSGTWEVTAGSTLNATTSSSKLFTAAAFANNGTVNWSAGNLFLANASQVSNNGLWDVTGNNSLNPNGGATSSFINNGIFRKSGGSGATTFNGIAFVNNDTIDAQTGAVNFNGGIATFNAGSVFSGAGEVNINSNATFNSGFTSANLDFDAGTFTGNNAALTGSADWTNGTFSGSWEVTAGSTLNATTSSSKLFTAATFANNGTINWSAGNLFLADASQVSNNGLWDVTGDNSLNPNGGATSTVTNNGIFRKSGGSGATTFNGIAFVNNDTIDAQTGAVNFNGGNATFNGGSVFSGGGEVNINNNATFNGGFTSSNVNFNAGTFTGNNAALTGTADWTNGTFSGSWDVTAGSTLNATTSSSKVFTAATFANNGTVNWQAGNLFLGSGSQITNAGTIAITGNNSINNNGGAPSGLTNNGLIEKTGGGGTTTLANGTGLDNNGTINVLSGTIALPTNFDNDGTLGGTGTFSLSGTLNNDGSIAPGATGATGTLSLTGNYIQSALGSFNAQLASSSSSDLFNISGMASLNGTLALSCILSCAISTGDSFVLLDSIGNLTGTFSNVTATGFLSGFAYNVVYDYANDLVRLDVTNAGMIPGPGGVPEPANWALMIAGFGLVGSAMRRRKNRLALA